MSDPMSDIETILETFEQVGALGLDITDDVYARYYAACPSAGALMAHVDRHMQGRMMQEVLRLLMSDDHAADEEYLAFEVRNHLGYAVDPAMYPDLFGAVRDVVRAALGTGWTPAHAAAWQRRIAALVEQVFVHVPPARLTGTGHAH